MTRFQGHASPFNTGLVLIAIALCLAVFAVLVWVSLSEAGKALDRRLLLALQTAGEETFPRGPAWMREAGRDLTSLGSVSVLAFTSLAVFGWLALRQRHRSMVLTAASIGLGVMTGFGLKLLFSQPRPDLVADVILTFTSSFPSNHAMGSLITFVSLAAVLAQDLTRRSQQVYLLALAILASLVAGGSRVYLGVHWPSDVLAGWVAGVIWLLLTMLVVRLWLADWLAGERHPDRHQ